MTYWVHVKFTILCGCKTTVRVPNFRACKECTWQKSALDWIHEQNQEPCTWSSQHNYLLLSIRWSAPNVPLPKVWQPFTFKVWERYLMSQLSYSRTQTSKTNWFKDRLDSGPLNPLMSRIERKYCLISTSYLTELCVFWWLFTIEDTLWCLSWGIWISLAFNPGHISAIALNGSWALYKRY